MKRLFVIICILSCSIPFFAQNRTIYVAVVNSNNQQVDEDSHRIIVDVFQKYLHKNYNVRLTRGNDLYAMQNWLEQAHQENTAAIEDVIDWNSQAAAKYCCIIEISQMKGYKGDTQYYINAKIYDYESCLLVKTANYPNESIERENILKDIQSREALQYVSLHLLKDFGFKIDEDIITTALNNYNSYTQSIGNSEKQEKEEKEEDNKKIDRKATLCSIIPGLGLMLKGHHWTGAAYLVGDAALIGGGVGMLVYANKQKDIFNKHNTSTANKEIARRNYNTANTVSYCCFGAALALYVGNFIHSYFATPNDKATSQFEYAITPSYNKVICGSPDMGFEFALRYNF